MKRFSSIMMLVATVAAVSCNKSTQTCEVFSYKAKCPAVENEAKTYLKDGKDVIWAAGDAINVLTASNNEKYTLTEGAASKEGTFSGNPVTGDSYAVYPYNASATFTDGVITTTLAATQNAKTAGFANNTNLAVAKEDNGTFAFKNVCGLIKFQIKGDNIAKVVITGNNNEDLAGKVNISFNAQGEPVYEVVEGEKSITIKTYNDAVMAPGIYYATVLPQTFTKGITITCEPFKFTVAAPIKQINTPVNTLVKKGESALELSRASVKPVGYVDAGLVWANGKTGAPVRIGGIRGSDVDHGQYLDFSTGCTYYAIGSYECRKVLDMTMITNGSTGLAPCSITAAGAYANATNLPYLGTPTDNDYINNWDSRTNDWFCYVGAGELSDADFDAITTTAQVKAIYEKYAGADNSNATHNYYASSNCVTNANRTTTNKYVVVKTSTAAEGVGYGILKFVGVAAPPSTTGQTTKKWYIEFFYKWGLEAPAAK